ncbi:MAG: L,D-transpeptidase family protein [Eubacteriales bacterium]|nr:L,D-transpeptidase family protein [Eubacteriales bacterium]
MSTRNRRSDRAKVRKKHRMRKLIAALSVCALIGVSYIGGRVYFSNHFFPKTMINAVDCGMKKEAEAYQAVSDYLSTYQLLIHSEEGDLPVKAEEVGLSYENNGELSHILEEQDVDRWFLHLNKKTELQAMKTSLDDTKLGESVTKLACMNPSNPRSSTNATLSYDEKEKTFAIHEGELGNAVNTETFTAAVKEAMLNGGKELDLLSGAYYLEGEFTPESEVVQKAKKTADKYLKGKVNYKDDGKEVSISKKAIASFIQIDEEYKVTLDEKAVEDYVSAKVSKKFDTTKNLTILKTPGSGNIYVASGDGSKAVDVSKEAKHVIQNLKSGKASSRKPDYVEDYLYSSNASIVKKDYIDINIPKQKVYVVIGNKIKVESDCVTGNLASGRSTPTGIYRIAYKTRNHHMVKYNAFVNYWMPYDTRYGIGLHDATWRSAFGGDIFRNDGSHACINLPLEKAAKIYDAIYAGIPVIVHW